MTPEVKLGLLLDEIAVNAFELIRSLAELAILPFELARLRLRDPQELAAENLVLRRQIAILLERGAKPQRLTAADRLTLAWLSRRCRSDAVVLFKPATLVRWHRQGFRLLCRWKSLPGRPPIPADLQALIRQMADENRLWGEERLANELLLKLGIRVSPRTVRKYLPRRPKGRGRPEHGQKWSTFLHNHAEAIVASNFLTTFTGRLQVLSVFLVKLASRRILHTNVTAHPTAKCTLQDTREALPWCHGYEWIIPGYASSFPNSDGVSGGFGIKVLSRPPRAPPANALCERLKGAILRKNFHHLIISSEECEEHPRQALLEWAERPRPGLGPRLSIPFESLSSNRKTTAIDPTTLPSSDGRFPVRSVTSIH